MTGARAVLHIVARDVRGLWPILLVWLVMLAAAAIQALWVTAPGSMALTFPLQGFPAPIIAGFVVVAATLVDPVMPGRARWMTLPVAAHTVALAKLVLLVALLAIAAAVQLWVYAGHALPWRDVFAHLAYGVTATLPFLVVPPLGVALWQDRRWSPVLVMLPIVAMPIGLGLLEESSTTWIVGDGAQAIPSWVRAVLPPLVAAVLFVALYRRGGASRGMRLTGVAAMLLLPFVPRATPPAPYLRAAAPTGGDAVPLADATGAAAIVGDSLSLAITLAPVRGTTTTLVPSRVVLRLAGGDSLVVSDSVAWRAYEPIVARAVAEGPDGTIPGDTLRIARPFTVAVPLDTAMRARLAARLVAVELDGVERRYTSVPALVLPLGDRAPHVGVYRRYRVTGAPPVGDTLVTVAASSMVPDLSLSADKGEAATIAYALHVPSRGAFVPLASLDPEYMPSPMIFLGETPYAYRVKLVPTLPGTPRTLLDASDARLVVFRNELAVARRVRLSLPVRPVP